MAYPVTAKWSDLVIKLGDGDSPEVFTASCVLRTEKGVALNTGLTETPVTDCQDAEAAAWMLREGVSLSATVTGQGLMDFAEFDKWRTWSLSMSDKNIQIEYALTAANNGGYFQGPFMLETFETTAARADNGGRIMANVSMQSAGVLTWTAASA